MEWLHHLVMIMDDIPNSLEWICPDGWTATVDHDNKDWVVWLTDGVRAAETLVCGCSRTEQTGEMEWDGVRSL